MFVSPPLISITVGCICLLLSAAVSSLHQPKYTTKLLWMSFQNDSQPGEWDKLNNHLIFFVCVGEEIIKGDKLWHRKLFKRTSLI